MQKLDECRYRSYPGGRLALNDGCFGNYIITLLTMFCFLLTYFFIFVLHEHVVFTHFFYLPVVYAGYCWGRRSVWLAVLLGSSVLIHYILQFSFSLLIEDLSRVAMLIITAYFLGMLRELGMNREKHFSCIIEGSPVPTFVINKEHIITNYNCACEMLTRLPAAEMVGTKNQWKPFYIEERSSLADLVVSGMSGKAISEFYCGKCNRSALIPGAYEGEIFFPDIGDGGKWLYITVAPIRNVNGEITGAIETLLDTTDRKNAEDSARHLAYHDVLTGLFNRTALDIYFAEALTRTRENNGVLAVMFIDLDNFGNINDALGHEIGDCLLKAVADRLSGVVKKDAIIARIGGDEFTLIISNICLREEVETTALNIIKAFQRKFIVRGHELYTRLSIGISIFPDDGGDIGVLMEKADGAMYRVKKEGKNNYRCYNSDIDTPAFDQLKLEVSMIHALERGEFVLHYQPQIEIATGKIVGTEALIRWQKPDLGLIPPGKFIRIAEETGLIVPIGEWVLRSACIQMKKWQSMGMGPIRLGINLSAVQFRHYNLVETIKNILDELKFDPYCLDLEITESIAIQNGDFNFGVLCELKQMGISISLDDFGTGYSSLNYLKSFPLDTIKIDRSFISNITENRTDMEIVTSLVDVAHKLGHRVTAEGVETKEQYALLERIKCDNIQGYFFHPPLSSEEFEAMVKDGLLTE